ncbi:unnamed protein product [Urochloa humidicola]
MDYDSDKVIIHIEGREVKVTRGYAMRRHTWERKQRERAEQREREVQSKKEQSRLRRFGIPSLESSSSRGTGRRRRRSEHATQTHVRQSSMYSDRPRRSRGGRAEPQTNLPDVMHAGDLGNGLPDSTIFVSSPYVEALSPRLEKYLKEHSVDSFEDACAYLCTGDNTFLVGAAAAEGDRYEDQPVPAPEQGTPSAGQHSKASKEDIAQNGKKWMTQEVKVAFEKYMQGKDHLKDHMYEFDELQHQCFSVENYYKIFHHFNFTMKMKAPGSMEWTTILFFAELKEILRRKMYFCCPLEPYENGHCHACKNQGMDDLKHPVIGAFDRGSPDTVFPYMYESDSSEESAPVRLEDEAEDESYVFDDERSHGVH